MLNQELAKIENFAQRLGSRTRPQTGQEIGKQRSSKLPSFFNPDWVNNIANNTIQESRIKNQS